MEKEILNVGFIGTGVMGKSMAANIMKDGHKLFVYNRTKERASELLEKGAEWCDTPKEAAEKADVVITIVGYPKDVEDTYLGTDGLIPNAKEGTILIDMTTSTPTLAKKIYEEAKKKRLHALDAPVSGGDIGAKNGTLTIMAGGDESIFEQIKTLLLSMGQNVVYQGEAGAGQHTKMCNQIAIASGMMGVTEATVYAKKAGLNPETVLKSISAGAAGSWNMTNLVPRMLKEDYSPGFFIKHFIKDMGIALEEADRMELELPGLTLAKKMYDKLAKEGFENDGTQALIKYYL